MTEKEFREELKKATNAIDLKTREDLLDTEMLQLVVTGRRHENAFAPVYVYTAEAPDKFTSRIALMKTLINSIRESFKPKELDLPPFSPGFVIFASATGTIEKVSSVGEVTPFLVDHP
jgi:hypothetical protein